MFRIWYHHLRMVSFLFTINSNFEPYFWHEMAFFVLMCHKTISLTLLNHIFQAYLYLKENIQQTVKSLFKQSTLVNKINPQIIIHAKPQDTSKGRVQEIKMINL